jgi:hypothetical protein
MSWRHWTTSPVSSSTKIVTIDQAPGLGSGGGGVEVAIPFLEDRGGRKKAGRGEKEGGRGEKGRSVVGGWLTVRKEAAGLVGNHVKNKGRRCVNDLEHFIGMQLTGCASHGRAPHRHASFMRASHRRVS